MKVILMVVFFLIVQFFPHTYEDAVMLATVIYKENYCTGETEQDIRDCQILTGAVVVNRVMNGGGGGKTIRDVIFAKGQYAESTKAAIGKVTPPDELIKLADDIMTYGTNVPNYVVFQSQQSKLGTVWKTIPNYSKPEYFATAGGHKDEGNDFHAKINSRLCYVFRHFSDILRSSGYTEHMVTVICDAWGNSNSFISRWLDGTDELGGTDS